MSRHDLGRIEAIIAQIQSIDADARDKYLERLKSKDPELHAEVLRFIGEVEDGFLEGTSDRIWGSVNPGTDLIGRTIRQYRIEDVVGRGGMGVVYKALDTKLGRHVALKFLPDRLRTDEAARERFMHEAQAVARLDHPNICAIYAVEETDTGVPFLAMALYEGETLRERLADGPLSNREAESVLGQTAAGLSAAHAKGLIHRDIKPDNLFITKGGTVKILDFGIAAAKDDQSAADDEGMMGTVTYMSPEQARGESATELSDVWALGAVGYEMVAGEPPFHADNRRATMNRILNEQPDELPPETPRRLERVIGKCLRKDPAKRYSKVGDVGAFLTRSRRIPRLPRRFKLVTSMLVLTGLVIGWWLGWAWPNDRPRTPSGEVLDVVPFVSTNGDSAFADFARGFSEDIRDRLGQTGEINVRQGRQGYALESYIPEVEGAWDRDVDFVFGGTMSKTDGGYRLEPELYNDKGERLWSQPREFLQSDIQAARGWILSEILARLDIELDIDRSSEIDGVQTHSWSAYEHYSRGLGLLKLRRRDALIDATRQFHEAISEDPSFASALAIRGLTRALLQGTAYVHSPDSMQFEMARKDAERALEIDPTNSSALVTLAFVRHNHDWDWESAGELYREAIEYNPQNADAWHFYASHRAELGHVSEAMEWQFEAMVLAPETPNYHANYAKLLYWDEDYDGVIEEARNWPEDFGRFPIYLLWKAFAYMDNGEFVNAADTIDELEAITGSNYPMALSLRGKLAALQGDREKAVEYASILAEQSLSPVLISLIYHALGDLTTALDYLKQAHERKDVYMTNVGAWPGLDDVRDSTRFQQIMGKMDLDR